MPRPVDDTAVMYTLSEADKTSRTLWADIEERQAQFFALCRAAGCEQVIEAQTERSLATLVQQGLVFIAEGVLTAAYRDRICFVLEAGDCINAAVADYTELSLRADFAVILCVVPHKQAALLLQSSTDAAALYRETEQLYKTLYLHLYATSAVYEAQSPSVRFFRPGEIIVEQGQSGAEVFTLVEGAATVLHNNLPVGVIESDEIFGALAALTGTERTATVVAETACTVAVLPAAEFFSLIRDRPQTVEKLVLDLAKKIIELNQRVAASRC